MGDTTQRPRLIATDLDGTLLRPDGSVSDRTRRVLERLRPAGIEIVFVTARPPRSVEHLGDLAGTHGTVICANGAFVYDLARRKVLQSHALPPAVIDLITADLRVAVPGIAFAVEFADGPLLEPGYRSLHPGDLPGNVRYGAVTSMDRAAGKVLARPQVDGEGDFVDRVAAIVGNRALVTRSGTADLAEIGPLGVTKATAVRDWCARRSIGPDAVWAFGDMPNDVPLLLWAGRSFAVAGAHHEARAAADYLCGANGDDGVAAVLEQMLLL